MKPTKLLLVLAVTLLMPALASAQGYYGRRHSGYYNTTPPTYQLPGGFWNRQGRIIFGANLGFGHMQDSFGDIDCQDCDYSTLSVMAAAHIGGFVSPRFALMGEVQANVQTISSDANSGDTTNLVESALMIAGQYWLAPQFWIKGGVGFANLHLEEEYYGDQSTPRYGTALMGALGYEIFSSRALAIDLEGRVLTGFFKGDNTGLADNNVTSFNLGLGISFF